MNNSCKSCTTCAKAAIASPGLLRIAGADGARWTEGANQAWYATAWQRRSGCGPTSASHLLWYLSRTREGAGALCPYDGNTRGGFLRLMEEVWRFVTPGVMGVNCTAILSEGAERYGARQGVALGSRVLNIPAVPMLRPGWEELTDFLAGAFADDLPVAFLNLSNGELGNLDNWHWVTLTGLDMAAGTATMIDQGHRAEIDLALWLRTTTLGGGFVALEPVHR